MFFNLRNVCYSYYSYTMFKFFDFEELVTRLYFKVFRNRIISIKTYPGSKGNPKVIYNILWSYFTPLKDVFTSRGYWYTNDILEIIQHSDSHIVTTLLLTHDFVAFDTKTVENDLITLIMKSKAESKKVLLSSVHINDVVVTPHFLKVLHSLLLTSLFAKDIVNYIKRNSNVDIPDTDNELKISDFMLDETIFKANDKVQIYDGYLVK